jgi:siroheme synthase (precorrin-2 oxidase/ferrochelatase)
MNGHRIRVRTPRAVEARTSPTIVGRKPGLISASSQGGGSSFAHRTRRRYPRSIDPRWISAVTPRGRPNRYAHTQTRRPLVLMGKSRAIPYLRSAIPGERQASASSPYSAQELLVSQSRTLMIRKLGRSGYRSSLLPPYAASFSLK